MQFLLGFSTCGEIIALHIVGLGLRGLELLFPQSHINIAALLSGHKGNLWGTRGSPSSVLMYVGALCAAKALRKQHYHRWRHGLHLDSES